MIDLTKPQILAEPVKCRVRAIGIEKWVSRWLIAITEGLQYWCLAGMGHDEVPTIFDVIKGDKSSWDECVLIDPNIKQMRKMPNAEIFRAIREGAVVRRINEFACNYWLESNDMFNHEICYNYTGTDADVWQAMEVEV